MDPQNFKERPSTKDIKIVDRQKLRKEEQEFFDQNYDSQGSIGQFLNFGEDEPELLDEALLELKGKEKGQANIQMQSEELIPKKKKQRSIYHNFQKHLVTTIRRTISIRDITKSGDIGEGAAALWELLIHQKFTSKEFLYVLFGVTKQEAEFDPNLLKKYKVAPIEDIFGTPTLRLSQKYLRAKVAQIFNDMDDTKILYQRRVEKKAEFILYVRQFINELEEGVCLAKKQYRSQKQSISPEGSQSHENEMKMEENE